MASTARIDELKKKFDENPRRYFAPLANEFRKAGEVEQAIMICEEFLPQQPGHMSGHIVYGQALFEASRFEESRTVFETALTLDPENLIALRHLGDIARGQGDLEAARRWYERVLEADPRNEEILALIAALDEAPQESAAPPNLSTEAPVPAVSTEEQRFAPPSPPPPPLPELIDLDPVGDVSTQLPESLPAQPTLAAIPMASSSDRAEGLESVEFTPPSGPTDRAHDLGASLEPAEFTAPAAPIAPLDGLEETAIGAFERAVPDGGPPLPMLDTSEPTPEVGSLPEVGPSTLEFAVPRGTEGASATGRAETSTMPELEPEGDSLPQATATDVPAELPPAVIAAEAQLMDLGDPIVEGASTRTMSGTAAAPVEPEPAPASAEPQPAELSPARSAPAAPFVTETMAELFLKQGFHDQARDVYRQLLEANPSDERLRRIVSELQPSAPAAAGSSVRDFLARFATLRPGARSAAAAPPSTDDFTDFDAVPPSPPVAEPDAPATSGSDARSEAPVPSTPRATPSTPMSSGVERGAASQGSGGSIDALFGTRSTGTSEDSAASALAQAFGGSSEPVPAITGRPARAANGELSLDSVFRDAPPRSSRASQSFSFDQFFSPESAGAERAPATPSGASADTAAPSEPGERSADDIEQFNSWLQGLKPK
jgi:tetratricopeptide (TPR) repeat protein